MLFYFTAAVLMEFLNILGRKAGHSAALAAVTELTPPFLVISEPDNLLDTPALEKFSTVPQGGGGQLYGLSRDDTG
jgi:hypothetical protein